MKKLCLFTSLFISAIISTSSPSRTVEFKSIHQIELDRYRDYEPPPSAFKEVSPLVQVQRDRELKREIFGFLPYWRLSHYDELHYDLISTIAYFGVELNSSGGITYYHSWPTYDLVDLAHQNGVKVVLVGICFNSDQIHLLVTDSSATLNAINNLLEQVELGSADGVNIDFELPRSADSSHVTAFMSALSDTFHAHNPEYSVTICVTAVNWNNRFQCKQLAQATDGLFIMGYDYHWSGSSNSGAVSPLTGGTYNVTNTVSYYLSETDYDSSKLILGIPYYGYDWPTAGTEPGSQTQGTGSAKIYSVAESEANSYGKLWDNSSQTPWYRYCISSQWHQCWYDDSTSLGLKYDLVNNKNLKGTGMWALSYDSDRSELWGAIYSHFVLSPPSTPTDFRVTNEGSANLLVAFSSSDSVTGYKLYKSTDGILFDSTMVYDTENIISGLSPNTVYFFKVKAVNEGGQSGITEVLGARTSIAPSAVLVVNGYDSDKTGNTHNFIIQHGFAVSSTGRSFNSCSNECIQRGIISLGDYEAVDWVLGQEDTPGGTFNSTEQDAIRGYLQEGGNLFISGSDIGYAIGGTTFYGEYLKANYTTDNTGVYSVDGVDGSIFSGITGLNFDDGTHGIYRVKYPDGIDTTSGSTRCLRYEGTDYYAGIQYSGNFGAGTLPGKLVYLSFPFETAYPESLGNIVMDGIMEFFEVSGVEEVEKPTAFLFQNYPNPFSTTTAITLSGYQAINTPRSSALALRIYDLSGRLIKRFTICDSRCTSVTWDGKDERGKRVPGGIYFCRLRIGENRFCRKLVFLGR